MMNVWSQCPNAVHINKILASSQAFPVAYQDAYQTCFIYADHNKAFQDTYDAAYYLAETHAHEYVHGLVDDKSWYALYYIERGAILALVAYEDSAHLLDSSIEELRLLVALGHPYASLFLPIAIVYDSLS